MKDNSRIITTKNITEEETELLKKILMRGSGFSGGAERIYLFYLSDKSAKLDNCAKFLKDEYGIGGCSWREKGYDFLNYDAKGITLEKYHSDEEILFKWDIIAKVMRSVIHDEHYIQSLHNIYFGNICIPYDINDQFGMKMLVDDKEGKSGLGEYIQYADKLFSKIGDVIADNYRNYPQKRLFGRFQRIGLIDRDKNPLRLTIIYCSNKGEFDLNAYLSAVKRLSEKYPDERVLIPTNTQNILYDDGIKNYIGIPEQYTETVFNEQSKMNRNVNAIIGSYPMSYQEERVHLYKSDIENEEEYDEPDR